jgi:hypothetical protein
MGQVRIILFAYDPYRLSRFYPTWQSSAILIVEIQGAKWSPQATVLLPEPGQVSADKARSFPK